MKNMVFKIIGLLVAVFVVSQVGHGEKANATTPEVNSPKKPLETTSHGCGCGCSSCVQSNEVN